MADRPFDLCDGCEHGRKVKGYGVELKECNYVSSNVNFPVQSCNSYQAKGTMTMYQMERMAFYIEKKKDQPGFVFTKKKNSEDFSDFRM